MSDSRPQHNPHGELGQALDKLPDEEAGIFRNLADVFRRPETVNVFATAAVFVAILFAATEVVDKSKTVGEWVRDFLAAGFVRDGKTLTNEIHPWIAIFFVALTGLQFVLLCSAIANFLVARSLRKERDLFSREKRRLDLESAEIKADRDRATGAVTQLEATRSSLLDQIDGGPGAGSWLPRAIEGGTKPAAGCLCGPRDPTPSGRQHNHKVNLQDSQSLVPGYDRSRQNL